MVKKAQALGTPVKKSYFELILGNPFAAKRTLQPPWDRGKYDFRTICPIGEITVTLESFW